MGVQAADAAKWGQFGNNVANAGGSLLYAWGNGAFNSAQNGSNGTGQFDVGKSVDYSAGGGSGSASTNGIDYKPLYT